MRYCSEDAPRTGERNVNCNKKTTSENVVLNKMFHPDERAPSFIFKQIEENHGRTVLQESRKLVSQYLTIEKQFSHLRFNHACKSLGILPRSLRFSPPTFNRSVVEWIERLLLKR